jgi:hypothetical protein
MVEQHVDGISIQISEKLLLIIKGVSSLTINNQPNSFAFMRLFKANTYTLRYYPYLQTYFLCRFESQKIKLHIPSEQEQLYVAKETNVEHKTLRELLDLHPYAFPV